MSDSETPRHQESRGDDPDSALDDPSGQDHSMDAESTPEPEDPPFLSLPQVRYPNTYVWLVLVSTLDILLTFLVLHVWGGYEVNPVAAAIIIDSGYTWAIIFKFAIVVFVVVSCEVVGRRRDRDGRALARGAVVISAIPVAYTFILLLRIGPAGVQ